MSLMLLDNLVCHFWTAIELFSGLKESERHVISRTYFPRFFPTLLKQIAVIWQW